MNANNLKNDMIEEKMDKEEEIKEKDKEQAEWMDNEMIWIDQDKVDELVLACIAMGDVNLRNNNPDIEHELDVLLEHTNNEEKAAAFSELITDKDYIPESIFMAIEEKCKEQGKWMDNEMIWIDQDKVDKLVRACSAMGDLCLMDDPDVEYELGIALEDTNNEEKAAAFYELKQDGDYIPDSVFKAWSTLNNKKATK